MSLADQKAAMRRDLRVRRRALQASCPDAAERVVDRFREAGLPIPVVAALYVSQGAEIDARPLALHLHDRGACIASPAMATPGLPLVFLGVDADALTPPPSARPLSPELIIAPLIAFDRRGYRLGQGGGYYDRTLQHLRTTPAPPLAIGLAYAGQEVARVPTDAHDQRLDGVLTERGFMDFRGDG